MSPFTKPPLPLFPSREPAGVARSRRRRWWAAAAIALASGLAAASEPRIAIGDGFVVVSRTDGTVWAWGRGTEGQLGDGRRTSSSRPVQVSGLSGIVDVFATDGLAAAIKADGTVYVWGTGGNGIFGSLLPDNTTRSNTPVQIPELSGIYALALGRGTSSAWASDTQGRVLQWGSNTAGQAGTGVAGGNGEVRKVPTPVPGLSEVFVVAPADDSFVAASPTAGFGWGANELGGLGVSARTTRGGPPLPVQPLPGIAGAFSIAALDVNQNAHFAVRPDGSVVGWGTNVGDQAGCGQVATTTITSPRVVSGLSRIIAAAGANAHALFLDENGQVFGCGSNASGQLGDGSTAGANAGKPGPLRVSLPATAVSIGAGRLASTAVADDGRVWVWGLHHSGSAGDGGSTASSVQTFTTPRTVVDASGAGAFNAGALVGSPALFTGTQSGPAGRSTVDLGLAPRIEDVGAEGRVYVAALLPDGGLLFLGSDGNWQVFDGRTLPPFAAGQLSRHVALPMFRDADLRGAEGIVLITAYGVGATDAAAQADLFNRSLFGVGVVLR